MDPNTNLIAFLDAAKAAVNEAGELAARAAALNNEMGDARAGVNTLKKKQQEQIDAAVRKRRAEIEKTFDDELGKSNSQLKKAKSRREKAKNQGIRERIEDETAELRADIKAIKARTKADFKANSVPAYCSGRLFGALYFPDSIGDIAIIIITFAIAFFVIPYGIYKLFFNGSTFALIVIYILDVLLFGGMYIGISRHTVVEHNQVLRQARQNNKAIGQDRKKIREITKRIENDENESYYDLAKYDDEIAHISQQMADTTMKKNEALDTFENVTRNIIVDEIVTTTKPTIDEAERQLADVTARYEAAEAASRQKKSELKNQYELYLGREFMSITKIERLKDIVDHGTAANISEAIEEYNRQYDI